MFYILILPKQYLHVKQYLRVTMNLSGTTAHHFHPQNICQLCLAGLAGQGPHPLFLSSVSALFCFYEGWI